MQKNKENNIFEKVKFQSDLFLRPPLGLYVGRSQTWGVGGPVLFKFLGGQKISSVFVQIFNFWKNCLCYRKYIFLQKKLPPAKAVFRGYCLKLAHKVPLIVITFGPRETDNINWMIKLTVIALSDFYSTNLSWVGVVWKWLLTLKQVGLTVQ